jgi:hypothetical protein
MRVETCHGEPALQEGLPPQATGVTSLQGLWVIVEEIFLSEAY